MCSSAQNRFTAVGRLAVSVLNAASIAVSNSRGGRSCCRRASSAMAKAAAQPMAGAPRTTIDRIASATSAAFVQLRYSRRSGRARWSISSSRPPCQHSAWTLPGIFEAMISSDDALIAAVHGHLRARGLGEKRPAHLRRQLRDVAAAYLGLEHVVGLVLLDRHAVVLRALKKHFFGP